MKLTSHTPSHRYNGYNLNGYYLEEDVRRKVISRERAREPLQSSLTAPTSRKPQRRAAYTSGGREPGRSTVGPNPHFFRGPSRPTVVAGWLQTEFEFEFRRRLESHRGHPDGDRPGSDRSHF
jgi:hypothetical protein